MARARTSRALAKGLIPKTERISYIGVNKANAQRSQGQPVQRISGQPFLDQIPVLHDEDRTPSAKTGEKPEIPENTGGKEGQPDLSVISEQISTSMKSMELHLKNQLGTINTRLKNVEQAKSVDNKRTKSQSTTNTGTLDLRQGVQEPPPAETIDITADQGDDDNEGADDGDENKEPPEGQTRVIVPDRTKDGMITFLPTPYAEQLAALLVLT